MDDLHQEMAQIKHDALVHVQEEERKASHLEHISEEIQNRLSFILSRFAKEFASGDAKLEITHMDADGFTITYDAGDGILACPFELTASTKGEAVTLQLKDGEWREAPNVSGNWGSWTNQKTVYSGQLDNEKIRSVLTSEFLKWYDSAIKSP